MFEQHNALIQSISLLLERSSLARLFLVAGIHTGRAVLSHFFHIAELTQLGPDDDGIVEYCVIDGSTRPWRKDRGPEDVLERKRWLIVAKLKWNNLD